MFPNADIDPNAVVGVPNVGFAGFAKLLNAGVAVVEPPKAD